MKRKCLSILLCLALIATISGCGKSKTSSDAEDSGGTASNPTSAPADASADTSKSDSNNVTLELETTWTADKLDGLKSVINDFSTQSGIKVDIVSPGDDYETVMKTRMASNDLPDLWETHGWSVARYSEYLMTLNDQSWFSRIDDSILPVIKDTNGNIFCCPLTIGVNTITYNKDAFEKAGVQAGDIRTWDDFGAACDKLLAAGITPIFCGDKDSSTIAQLCESIPPAFLTTPSVKDNQADALKDGSFDWNTYWTPIAKLVDTWMQKGYFNKDILTSDNDAGCKALANGQAAMIFGGSNNITAARTYNPDAKLGLLACPAATQEGKCYLSMGEGCCYGIWKETKHPDEAKKLLDYLASADAITKLAGYSGDIIGMKDVNNDEAYVTKELHETEATFADDIEYVPLFDREYLPSGMWDDLGVAMTQIAMSPGKAVEQSVEYLKDAYTQKISQQ